MNRATGSESGGGSVIGLAAACALLALALTVSGVGFGWFAQQRSGEVGIAAAAVASGVCWLAGSLALATTFFGQRFGYALQAVMAATGVRLGLPLITGIVLKSFGGPLVDAGLFRMIMGSYLVMLLVETLLSLKFVSSSTASRSSVSLTKVA